LNAKNVPSWLLFKSYNKAGTVKYARARHYTSQQNGQLQFEYLQQSLEYLQRKLCETPKSEIGYVGQELNVDLQKEESSPKLIVAGPVGLDPKRGLVLQLKKPRKL